MCAAAVLLAAGTVPAQAAPADPGWQSFGFDTSNSRYNGQEKAIGVANAATLTKKWFAATAGDVSATPAVDGSTVYVPDRAGFLYALDRASGSVKWKARISDYTGIPGDYSRSTPAISGSLLILGDQAGKAFSPDGYLLGINKNSGALAWRTKVTGGYPILTQSATVKGGIAYVGVASYEEALVAFGFPLTFRGRMMAVDANTGAVRWTTYMAPEGYTGSSVWGSSPAIDTKRNLVYVATGNNYSVPDAVTACVAAASTDADRAACVDPSDLFDAIVALDMTTGAVRWSTRALPSDAWNLGCGIPGIFEPSVGCPDGAGPDYDFGQAPSLFTAKVNGKSVELVGAGQKSGKYWALNPDTGAVVWATQAVPGGVAGGLQWGSATDGRTVWLDNSNSAAQPWTLKNGSTVTSGGWAALDAATGAITWTTADPSGGNGMGPISAANGVAYACTLAATGNMYAMDAATGAILWTYPTNASCLGGAAITGGMVFWGTGYQDLGAPSNGNQGLYAFGL